MGHGYSVGNHSAGNVREEGVAGAASSGLTALACGASEGRHIGVGEGCGDSPSGGGIGHSAGFSGRLRATEPVVEVGDVELWATGSRQGG